MSGADQLVGVGVERSELGDHLLDDAAGVVERLRQPLAASGVLEQLRPSLLAALGDVDHHPLAVLARLGDHLPTFGASLLPLAVGLALGLVAPSGELELGVLAQLRRLLVGLAQQTLGAFLGSLADLPGGFTSGGQHPCGLLSEHAGHGRLVELGDRRRVRAAARPLEFGSQFALAPLQLFDLFGDLLEERLDLGGVVTLARRAEGGGGDSGR